MRHIQSPLRQMQESPKQPFGCGMNDISHTLGSSFLTNAIMHQTYRPYFCYLTNTINYETQHWNC